MTVSFRSPPRYSFYATAVVKKLALNNTCTAVAGQSGHTETSTHTLRRTDPPEKLAPAMTMTQMRRGCTHKGIGMLLFVRRA